MFASGVIRDNYRWVYKETVLGQALEMYVVYVVYTIRQVDRYIIVLAGGRGGGAAGMIASERHLFASTVDSLFIVYLM